MRRAIIVGGSLGGLCAANLLGRIGWDVSVHERSEADLAARGAGLGAREALFQVFRRMRIGRADVGVVTARSRLSFDWDGTVAEEIAISSMATAWDCVYKALKDALPAGIYHRGSELDYFEDCGDGVDAYFADGSRASGDLLIAADGSKSRVRAQLLPKVAPRYAGYVAWRGLVTEDELPESLAKLTFDRMTFCFPDGEMSLSVPAPALRLGGAKRCQVTWFRSVQAEVLRHFCKDEMQGAEDARCRATAILAPQHAAMIMASRRLLLQPIHDLEVSSLVFGRAVLLGDAGFVARPHVGTGVTKAAVDAECLATCLEESNGNLGHALSRYDAQRTLYGKDLVLRGRHLGAYLEAQSKPREQRTARELYRRPAIVMREFGAVGQIRDHKYFAAAS
jgi:2-polyprenyl-6-methoxyphenol hydroxylase-like FAD-dependent oxidoreductase